MRRVEVTGGVFVLADIVPGRYSIHAFRRSEEPVGEPLAIDVRADGSVTPHAAFTK